jgi:hypothetical protein
MTKTTVRRRATALASATAAALLTAAATPTPAAATTTRTINSYVTCADGTLMYGFAINYGTGWTYTALGASGYQVNSYEKEVTFIIPSTASSVALDTYCGGNGYVQNSNWVGYTYGLTPGTSTATANWSCSLFTYLYGAIERTCSLTSISYS